MAERVAKQRFLALRVNEVSLVGSPANEEEFITVKSADPEEQPAPAATLMALKKDAGDFFSVAKGYKAGQPRAADGKWSGGGHTAGGGAPGPSHTGESPIGDGGTKTVPHKVDKPEYISGKVASDWHKAQAKDHKGRAFVERARANSAGASKHEVAAMRHKEAAAAHLKGDNKAAMNATGKAMTASTLAGTPKDFPTAPSTGAPNTGLTAAKKSTDTHEEQTMAGETTQQVTTAPVAKDVSVGDEWVPMCMGKSCDSLSNICRACPAKVLCSELCHMNVPPDEPNTQESSYKPTPAAAAVAEGLFPNGGQQTTKENKPMETPATTPPATTTEVAKANETPAPAPATTEVAKAGKMQDHDACKGKGCKDCNDSGKVPVAKAEEQPKVEPAKEEPTAKGKPQFSEERLEALRKSLESIAGIMKEVDPEGFNKLMGQLGGGPKTPIAPTTVASPVSVAKEDMEAIIAKTLAPFKEEITALGKKVEEVAQVRGVSKSLTGEEPTSKGTQQAQPFWKGVL